MEQKGQFNIGAVVAKKGNADDIRLIVFGDQYAFSTPMIAYSSSEAMDFRSLEYLGNSLLLLDGKKELLELKNKATFNHSLYKISETEFPDAVRKTFLVCLLLPMVLIISTGFYFSWRRRILLNEKVDCK